MQGGGDSRRRRPFPCLLWWQQEGDNGSLGQQAPPERRLPCDQAVSGAAGALATALLDDVPAQTSRTILFPAVRPREGYLGEFLSLPPDGEIPKGRAHVLTPTRALGPETCSRLGHQLSLRKGLKDRQILQSPICKPWGDMTSAPLTLKSHALAQTEGAARAVYPRRREGARPRT